MYNSRSFMAETSFCFFLSENHVDIIGGARVLAFDALVLGRSSFLRPPVVFTLVPTTGRFRPTCEAFRAFSAATALAAVIACIAFIAMASASTRWGRGEVWASMGTF